MKEDFAREMGYLKQKQSLPLEAKIVMSLQRIRNFYDHHEGQVHVSFSGGKDSTVLADLVRTIYPEVPLVFCNTGLEYPEIVEFVKTFNNVIELRPKKNFKQVIEEFGYPVATKRIAAQVEFLKTPASPKNDNKRKLYLEGIKKDGSPAPRWKLSEKWKYLIDSPIKISAKCCDIMKKQPFYEYEKQTGRKPFIGVLAVDSEFRLTSYLRHGCNVFEGRSAGRPMMFWTEQDVLQYIKQKQLPISSVYGELRTKANGELFFSGLERTGCVFCCFGLHLERRETGENRFQKMYRSRPKLWRYCMENLGFKEVLEVLNEPSKPLGFGLMREDCTQTKEKEKDDV